MRWFVAIACAASLAGCADGGASMVLATGANLASAAMTDKLLVDHVASYVTGKDCNLTTRSERGTYCSDKAQQVAVSVQPAVYCHRTLGRVDCFEQPDPYAQHLQPIVGPSKAATPQTPETSVATSTPIPAETAVEPESVSVETVRVPAPQPVVTAELPPLPAVKPAHKKGEAAPVLAKASGSEPLSLLPPTRMEDMKDSGTTRLTIQDGLVPAY